MYIKKTISSSEIESMLGKVGSDVIELPVGFKKLRIGILPRVAQLIITKLKKNPEREVKFPHLDLKDNKKITSILEDPQCLTAILMSNTISSIDQENFKPKINKNLIERFEKSPYYRGQRLQLTAVDHSIEKYAFPSFFYSSEEQNQVKSISYFKSLIKSFLSEKSKISNLKDQDIDSIATILRELIENTEQHGKSDFKTGKNDKSIRSVIIDYRLINKELDILSVTGERNRIHNYLLGLQKKYQTIHLIEISVFDSGSGIIKTLSSKYDLRIDNISNQAKEIEKAFTKGVSSKPNGNGYGRGLDKVKHTLNVRQCYLQIRTDELSLYRDFNRNPLSELENASESISFYDEKTGSDSQYTKLHKVSGLSYSILVPIK
ncbi:hypothetical protein ABMA57_17355 [Saccharospirillum sp. HFRX-1]|uniref:hypothetical protein n=1 Tax=unclassified Saccharospirillum TaxID=2633430 RepID=UPI0037226599